MELQIVIGKLVRQPALAFVGGRQYERISFDDALFAVTHVRNLCR